jgi:hypothetical protein
MKRFGEVSGPVNFISQEMGLIIGNKDVLTLPDNFCLDRYFEDKVRVHLNG